MHWSPSNHAEQSKKRTQGKPLNTESELTHGCIPQNFASCPATKASAFCSVGSTHVRLSSKVSCSKLKSSCRVRKITQKTHPTSAMKTELYVLLRKWARTSIKLGKLRVRSLIQDQHLTEEGEREGPTFHLAAIYLTALANHKTRSRNSHSWDLSLSRLARVIQWNLY